jgi:hypothetical protein
MDGDVWHLVEAKRDDGAPTIFRIRDLEPRRDLPTIFVVEMPYPITELSRLPSAAAYRRLAQFEEQWLLPACAALGYELVGLKIEEGSFFLYMYGSADPNTLVARLSPFDVALGFYDDADPDWGEYATLRDLLTQARALPPELREMPPALTAPAKKAKPKTTAKLKKKKKTPAPKKKR